MTLTALDAYHRPDLCPLRWVCEDNKIAPPYCARCQA